MFKNIKPELFARKEDRTFSVLVWKDWNKLAQRHIPGYDSRNANAPDCILTNCSVKNCKFSGNNNLLFKADAVIMTGDIIPKVKTRNLNQRWIFLSENSPMHASFLKPPYHRFKDLANIFNWTMSYRSDSDIPIPYGRTLPLRFPNEIFVDDVELTLSQIVPFWEFKQFSVLANILISNCSVRRRMEYLQELRKHMQVDVRGNCSEDGASVNSCPGNTKIDCILTKDYLFYLVLESASCRQYLTDKCFQHAFSKGAIPVIMGPPLEDCEKLLPPNSFLHVSSYKSPVDLAAHMYKISTSFSALLHFHAWRTHFKIENEHGYFGVKSQLFCRVCEALNYNDGGVKNYDADDLELYFDKKITCDLTYV